MINALHIYLLKTLFAAETVHMAHAAAHVGHAAHTGHTAELALAHALGELLEHLKALQKAVHIRHLLAAAGGDALFAAGVEDLGIFPLLRGHGLDDGLGASHLLFIDLGVGHLLAHTGDHTHHLAQIAHILQLLQLLQIVGQRRC